MAIALLDENADTAGTSDSVSVLSALLSCLERDNGDAEAEEENLTDFLGAPVGDKALVDSEVGEAEEVDKVDVTAAFEDALAAAAIKVAAATAAAAADAAADEEAPAPVVDPAESTAVSPEGSVRIGVAVEVMIPAPSFLTLGLLRCL